jgi:hypothetical protein
VLNHSKEMAAAHQKEFGTPVKLSPGIKNASEEWIVRFFKNAIISTAAVKIFNGITDVKQKQAPVGITSWSQLRETKKGIYEGSAIYGLEPVFGFSFPQSLLFAIRPPIPMLQNY